MKSNHQMFSTGGVDGWARDYLLCCLRYLIASSMQILEAMEGLRDTCMYCLCAMRSQGVVSDEEL